ncbi:MAG: cytochrome C biosynthesis protein [Amoebophilaceae bacterium]|nr:cytochrome C biosynthesis protein [Amoebophilaceae bacterium]
MKTIDINTIPREGLDKSNHGLDRLEKVDQGLDENNKPYFDEDAARVARKRKQYESYAIGVEGTKNRFYALCLWLIAFGIGFFFYRRHQNRLNILAQDEMFKAVYYFESGEFDKALHGDGTNKGFVHILEDYIGTKAGEAARLYASISYMHKKDYNTALLRLLRFSSSGSILRARAWAAMGDGYSEQKIFHHASKYYLKAANHRPNSIFSPKYLAKAAIAFEAHEKYKEACDCHKQIINKYPQSLYYELALKESGRLSARL